MRVRIIAGVVLAGLFLWGGSTLFVGPSEARAEEAEDEFVSNPMIDCSTNAGYRDNYISEAFSIAGGPRSTNQSCNACHQNAHPVPGQGDRPEASQATVLVYNRLKEPVDYQVRAARGGEEWKNFTLKPGQIVRHSWRYSQANQNRSPVYYLKYPNDPELRTRRLIPIATPNRNLGSVYFFDADDTRQVRLFQPGSSVARRRG